MPRALEFLRLKRKLWLAEHVLCPRRSGGSSRWTWGRPTGRRSGDGLVASVAELRGERILLEGWAVTVRSCRAVPAGSPRWPARTAAAGALAGWA